MRRVKVAYDILGIVLKVTSYDAASGGSIVNQVQRAFNGLGQMITEWQSHSGAVNTSTTPKIEYTYSEMASGANHSRLTGMGYPSGFDLRYDYASSIYTDAAALNDRSSRVSDVFSPDDNTMVQAFDYFELGAANRDARGTMPISPHFHQSRRGLARERFSDAARMLGSNLCEIPVRDRGDSHTRIVTGFRFRQPI